MRGLIKKPRIIVRIRVNRPIGVSIMVKVRVKAR